MARYSYLVFFLISYFLLLLSLAQVESFSDTSCPLHFLCGNLGYIGFPFTNRTHPECGLMIIDDCNESVQKIQLAKNGPWYNITDIDQDNTITVEDQVFQNHLKKRSCEFFQNLTLPRSPLLSFEITYNLTLFKCPQNLHSKPTNFSLSCNDSFFYYNHPNDDLPSLPPKCSLIQLPVNNKTQKTDLFNMLTGGFSLQVHVPEECRECHGRRGQCQSDIKGNFHCSYTTGIKTAGDTRTSTWGSALGKKILNLKLVLGASGSGICILIILAFCFRKKIASYNTMIFRKKTTENYRNIEDFLRNYGSLAPKRHSYADIKKMTSSFKHKLGQGGYGGVYKGKLHDGRNVAVKVLNESKGNGEDFINEVASISRTSHVNIVTLLGFCFEGQRRALIYEFVPNRSLERFIYEKNPLETENKLKWQTLYEIAVGIARGLEYLHRGCSTRILHFDIKPHNILLDEDFCPKISDFGLAKICPRKESIVSMTGTRGTVGYIAPEVFCRNFGNVSHKSDVYSYGMLIFEMTGRKNNNVGANRSSDVYFPDWIYKSLETDEELLLQGIENDEDKEYARKMIMVSLWCIQTNPSDRPAMNRVVEMLEGSLDSLQIPPKPFLSSPGSQPGSSTILECQTESSPGIAHDKFHRSLLSI